MAMPESGGMQMIGQRSDSGITTDVVASVTPAGGEEDPCPGGAPCEMPGTPVGCPVAFSCASAVPMPGDQLGLDLFAAPSERLIVSAVREPHTRLSPPELPPPRA